MNTDNLHSLINRYEENFYTLNNSEHDEIFKWRAAKRFRDVWFSEEAKSMTFSERFNAAKKEFSILMDNSYVSPSNGIVKIAEQDQDAVERLFTEVLFADDGGDIVARQNNMDKFLEEFDKLRAKYYPQSFKFKQDRHSVSCYLAFYAPEQNYIYRYSDAEEFAQNIEFGKDIGSGESFRLERYYEMCDMIVEALKEHPSLLEKHFTFLSDKCYRDDSLHLLAFDLMYCCRTYSYYAGMKHASKKDSIKAFTEAEARAKEAREKQEKIDALVAEISELERKASVFAGISLINVQVYQATYGSGTIIEQEVNKIKVRFESCEKTFIINRKYLSRPTFEDGKETVDAFTEYDEIVEKIKKLKGQLSRLV